MQVFERILFGNPIWPSQNSTHNSGLQLLGGHLRRHPGLRRGNPGGAALCIYMGLAIPYKILTAKSKSRTCMYVNLFANVSKAQISIKAEAAWKQAAWQINWPQIVKTLTLIVKVMPQIPKSIHSDSCLDHFLVLDFLTLPSLPLSLLARPSLALLSSPFSGREEPFTLGALGALIFLSEVGFHLLDYICTK